MDNTNEDFRSNPRNEEFINVNVEDFIEAFEDEFGEFSSHSDFNQLALREDASLEDMVDFIRNYAVQKHQDYLIQQAEEKGSEDGVDQWQN